MESLKTSTKFIIVNQIIITICQMISIIYCFFDKDERDITIFINLAFICFFLTVIIDIKLTYDFTRNKGMRLFLNIILLSISGFFQFGGFFCGIFWRSPHELSVLFGIIFLDIIVYMIAYLCIVICVQSKSNQEMNQLGNVQFVNPLNYNDNVYYNINDNIINPQNDENIKTTAN